VDYEVEVDEDLFVMCWCFIEEKKERTKVMWVWGL